MSNHGGPLHGLLPIANLSMTYGTYHLGQNRLYQVLFQHLLKSDKLTIGFGFDLLLA